jgi:hypothetical protein
MPEQSHGNGYAGTYKRMSLQKPKIGLFLGQIQEAGNCWCGFVKFFGAAGGRMGLAAAFARGMMVDGAV